MALVLSARRRLRQCRCGGSLHSSLKPPCHISVAIHHQRGEVAATVMAGVSFFLSISADFGTEHFVKSGRNHCLTVSAFFSQRINRHFCVKNFCTGGATRYTARSSLTAVAVCSTVSDPIPNYSEATADLSWAGAKTRGDRASCVQREITYRHICKCLCSEWIISVALLAGELNEFCCLHHKK